MEEVLDYCAYRYDTLILTTAQPEFYEPFGFRVVGEHIFIAKCDSAGSTDGFRLLINPAIIDTTSAQAA
jgi:predicted N-acetyltransferase YhbS